MKKYLFLVIYSLAFFGLSGQQVSITPASETVQSSPEDDFYATDKVRELRITFAEKNWENSLDSLRLYGNDLLSAKLEIEGQTYENVGIRYRGSKSFQTGSKRNAFHIKLNHKDKKQNLQGYKTLKLSNALRDPSMVREVLGYEVARRYMPAPQANYARLFINGEYYGLFINIEAVDKAFLDKHFDSHDHTFIKASSNRTDAHPEGCKNKIYGSLEYQEMADCYPYNFELKSDAGWDDLIQLTKALGEGLPETEALLNVDRTLWMLAFNNVLVNLNSYTGQQSQNYYLYKDNLGQFNPIIWDLNLAFGSFKNTGNGSDLNLEELQNLDPLLHVDNIQKPLISTLLKTPLYRKAYLAHIRSIIYDYFVSGLYEKRAKELQQLISLPFYNDPHRFYEVNDFNKSLTTTIGKRSKIPGLVELMSPRTRFLKKHPEVAVIPPEVSGVKVTKREQFSSEAIRNFQIQAKVDKLPKRVKLYYRYTPNDAYKTTFMADDGNNNDGEAGDKIFGVTILPEGDHTTIEYFILTENAKAINIDPPNYMFKPYKVSLAELN